MNNQGRNRAHAVATPNVNRSRADAVAMPNLNRPRADAVAVPNETRPRGNAVSGPSTKQQNVGRPQQSLVTQQLTGTGAQVPGTVNTIRSPMPGANALDHSGAKGLRANTANAASPNHAKNLSTT